MGDAFPFCFSKFTPIHGEKQAEDVDPKARPLEESFGFQPNERERALLQSEIRRQEGVWLCLVPTKYTVARGEKHLVHCSTFRLFVVDIVLP